MPVNSDDDTYIMVGGKKREEVAAYVVRACNRHDKLVEKLEYLTRFPLAMQNAGFAAEARAALAEAAPTGHRATHNQGERMTAEPKKRPPALSHAPRPARSRRSPRRTGQQSRRRDDYLADDRRMC